MSDPNNGPQPDERPLTPGPRIDLPDWLRDASESAATPSIPSDPEAPATGPNPTGPIPADGLAEAIPDWLSQPASTRTGQIDTSSAPKIDFGNLIESSDLPIWIRRLSDPNAIDEEEALLEPEPTPSGSEIEKLPATGPTPWPHRIESIGGETTSMSSEVATERERLSRTATLAVAAAIVIALALAAIFLL
jgi:hypothetical protein